MKCLCCQQSFHNLNSLKDHYISHHDIDKDNYFFKKLFIGDRVFMQRKCFRCEHICYNEREEKIHYFLSHHQQGGRLPTGDKPLKKIYSNENLQKYCITFDEHSNYYYFFDSREIMSEFLQIFENNFAPRVNLGRVRFNCTFTLINRQPSWPVGFAELQPAKFGPRIFMREFILAAL